MRDDDTSNSKPNSCPLQRSLGKSYTVFIPTSNRRVNSNPVVKQLAQQFDYVNITQAEHCSTPSKCQQGIQAEAFRLNHKKACEQEDMALVLKIIHDGLGRPDRLRLLDIKDDIAIYSVKCKRNFGS